MSLAWLLKQYMGLAQVAMAVTFYTHGEGTLGSHVHCLLPLLLFLGALGGPGAYYRGLWS